jgi:hypothetical protein
MKTYTVIRIKPKDKPKFDGFDLHETRLRSDRKKVREFERRQRRAGG